MEMEEAAETRSLTLADVLAEQERTVRRLRQRVLRYTAEVENKVSRVEQVVHAGDFAVLNDLGELQQSATGFDVAVAALVTANDALELLRKVRS